MSRNKFDGEEQEGENYKGSAVIKMYDHEMKLRILKELVIAIRPVCIQSYSLIKKEIIELYQIMEITTPHPIRISDFPMAYEKIILQHGIDLVVFLKYHDDCIVHNLS